MKKKEILCLTLILLIGFINWYGIKGTVKLPVYVDEWNNLELVRLAEKGEFTGISFVYHNSIVFLHKFGLSYLTIFKWLPLFTTLTFITLFYLIGEKYNFGLISALFASFFPNMINLLGFSLCVAISLAIILYLLLYHLYTKGFKKVSFTYPFITLVFYAPVGILTTLTFLILWIKDKRWTQLLIFLSIILISINFVPLSVKELINLSYEGYLYESFIYLIPPPFLSFGIIGIFYSITKGWFKELLITLLLLFTNNTLFRMAGSAFLGLPERSMFMIMVIFMLFCSLGFKFLLDQFPKHNLPSGLVRSLLILIIMFFGWKLMTRTNFYQFITEPAYDEVLKHYFPGNIASTPWVGTALQSLGYDVLSCLDYRCEPTNVKTSSFLKGACADNSFIVNNNVRGILYDGYCIPEGFSYVGGDLWIRD